jgi:hypothetical protein
MSKDENTEVFQGTSSEDVRLERLGYEQGTMIKGFYAHKTDGCYALQSSSGRSAC